MCMKYLRNATMIYDHWSGHITALCCNAGHNLCYAKILNENCQFY